MYYQAKLKQGGMLVVEINAPTIEKVENEISHYVMMYAQDGVVEVIRNYKLVGKELKE